VSPQYLIIFFVDKNHIKTENRNLLMRKAHLSSLSKDVLIEIICTIGAEKDKKYNELVELIEEHDYNIIKCDECKKSSIVKEFYITENFLNCKICKKYYHNGNGICRNFCTTCCDVCEKCVPLTESVDIHDNKTYICEMCSEHI